MTGNAATDAALTAAARLSFSNFICWEMLPELEDLALPVALGTAPVADAAPAFPAPGADAAGFGPSLGEGGSMVLCREGGERKGRGGLDKVFDALRDPCSLKYRESKLIPRIYNILNNETT